MTIQEIVRQAEQNYIYGTTVMGKYVSWSMHDTIEKIDAYLNSKHTTGDTDTLGREKPFFNIVTAATNIWYRATDIDRKNIRILPSKTAAIVPAFLASIKLQEWMDKERFGVFLNQWGRTLAKYGSAVSKWIERDGKLVPSVIPWNRLIVDPVSFNALPTIEKFYLTPEQLKQKKEYNPEIVTALLNSIESRETMDGQKQDTFSNFIELYEVHGRLPVSTYKLAKGIDPKDEDEDEYAQQMHVVSFVQNKDGNYSDYTVYCGYESQHPYRIDHLIEEDGRTLAIGSVEYLFDAQWMQNHSIKQWKDQMDLASKLIFQTSDTRYLNRNVLSAIETGDIMIHAANQPLTLINNQGHDITSIQAFINQWRVMEQELTSTPEALRGTTQPSGTPYRLAAILQQEAQSLFEIMTENKGLAIEDMLRDFVIPHLKTKLNTKDEIVAILDDHNIAQIDSIYIPKAAIKRYNEKASEDILEGELPEQFDQASEEEAVKEELDSMGNQRFFVPDEIGEKTWKDILKDLEWNVKVEITNENVDKNSVLTTLTSIYQTLAQTDPANAKLVLNKILSETSVVSPLELTAAKAGNPVMPNTAQAGEALTAIK